MGGATRPFRRRDGFTLVELLIVALLGTVLVTAAFVTIISQSRLFTAQADVSEARTTLRATAALLTTTLKEASATGNDLSAISDTSFTVRTYRASGTVCSYTVSGSGTRFGLQEVRGDLGDAQPSSDSVVVYDVSDNGWMAAVLDTLWVGTDVWASAPSGGGTPVCFWGDSTTSEPRPRASVLLGAPSAVVSAVRVGAPLRIFRSTEYGIFQEDGAWWFGRRVGGSPDWELLTGPVASPSAGGVSLDWYRSDGGVATSGPQVSAVEVFLWARSGPGGADVPDDSLRTRIHLRNNAGS